MALVKDNLQGAIRAALQNATDHHWSLDQVAAAWASAIHAYVSAAEVAGVTSSVSVDVPLTDPVHVATTAHQTDPVNLT